MRRFDGLTLPYADRSHDAVMLIDVLHHTNDPIVLLREAARVARRAVVVKDHLREGFLAGPTLRFMDRVGNRRYGVPLPYTYWRTEQWGEAFRSLGLHVERWRDRLGLYAWPLHLLFERSLHFAARLTVASGQSEEGP